MDIISAFQARHIMAPLIPEGTVDVSAPVRQARELLEKNSFDYGVVREGHRIIGLVARGDLGDLDVPLQLGPPVKRLELEYLLPETTPISGLVRYLAIFPFQLVVQAKNIVGVVHESDLNKHPVYAYFYCLLSRLEQNLAELVGLLFSKADQWRGFLSPERWEQIESRWIQAKDNGRQVDPVHYLCFSDYIRIIASSPEALNDLGFKTKGAWKDFVGAMDDLRNDVMHPVRNLVGSHRSVGKLADSDERIQNLIDRTSTSIRERRKKFQLAI
jgi:hypothetical protein